MERFSRPMRTTRKVTNLQQARPSWYRVTNQATGPHLVHIFDEIGFFGVAADEFVAALSALAGDIELHLNSPGGDVFDGIAIFNTLKQRSGAVAVVVDGLAASAASFIAQAASPGQLAMAPHSQMMIHDGFGLALGNAADMRQMADLLDKASDNIASIYADRSGQPTTHWREKMRDETWYSDREAVNAGLADKVLGDENPQDSWDLSVYAHAGSQPHPHVDDASYDDSAWDGGAALGSCSTASDYRSICAGEHNAGTPDERQHWALPHHKSPGAAPNRNGVNNALSRLPGTQDLKDKGAAESHLNAHARLWADSGSGSGSASDEIDPGLLARMFSTALEGGKS